MTVRCGQCMGCRLHRARNWAIRCVHEASLHDQNIFCTITYSDEHLPYGGTLVRSDIQKFIKRLRKKGFKIRVFYCGEYGGETERPHYHALFFGYEPNDKELISTRDGKKFYRSDKLDAIWGMGHINFSDVTFQSAAYTAGYITKKINGDQAEEHYRCIDPDTGEIIDRLPEFQGQSLKPGIGEPWIRKWLRDVYPRDQLIMNGTPMAPPSYYDQVLEKTDPKLFEQVRQLRKQKHVLKRKEKETPTGTIAFYSNREPDEYYGSSRQLFAKNKISISKQRLRKEQ